MIDAIRKVGPIAPKSQFFRHSNLTLPPPPLPQMTHANVGSLLVYDPSKVKVHERNSAAHDADAVVGIITERGTFHLLFKPHSFLSHTSLYLL